MTFARRSRRMQHCGMDRQRTNRLLALDAAINLVLGLCLLVLPRATIAALGLPQTGTLFYVALLGAVLTGIAIALWLERGGLGRGLGLPGAIAINLLGAGTVAVWLVRDPFDMPLRGYVVLWAVVVLVLGTAALELRALRRADR